MQSAVDARSASRRRSVIVAVLAMGGFAAYMLYSDSVKRHRRSEAMDVARMRSIAPGTGVPAALTGVGRAPEARTAPRVASGADERR